MLKGFYYKLKNFLKKGTDVVGSKYVLIAHEENYQDSNKIYAKVRLRGTSKSFYKPVSELYQKKWLSDFEKEDVAFIAVLNSADQDKNYSLIKMFPRKKKLITQNVIFLGMLFTTCLILSNLTAFKIIELHFGLFGIKEIDFPSALIFFPLTYFFDDTLTEVYGFKISRFIIWGGLICNCIVTLGTWATVYMPSAPVWHFQKAYSLIYNNNLRIFVASLSAYLLGEFCNSVILAKLKVLTNGKWLWLRVISSSSVGVGLDSIIFCNMAFLGVLPTALVWKIALTQYVIKVGYEIVVLPLTYRITRYLKKKDAVDHYDFSTKFNPFSLQVN